MMTPGERLSVFSRIGRMAALCGALLSALKASLDVIDLSTSKGRAFKKYAEELVKDAEAKLAEDEG